MLFPKLRFMRGAELRQPAWALRLTQEPMWRENSGHVTLITAGRLNPDGAELARGRTQLLGQRDSN